MRLLLIFLKEPIPGTVKTRLAAETGSEMAAIIYRAMVRILLQQLSGLEDCRIRFCYAPDDAHDAMRFWILPEIMDTPAIHLDPEQIDFHPQGDGDLGERLQRAMARAFEEGFQKVAVIGSDCIEIGSRWIHASFAQLSERHQAVIGPSTDGGYHLLATREHFPRLFEEIPWSTPEVCQTTLERAADEGVSIYTLPPLPDIDTNTDYEEALAGPLGKRLKKLVEADSSQS